MMHVLVTRQKLRLQSSLWGQKHSKVPLKLLQFLRFLFLVFNLFTTSESPKHWNSNSPNLLLWFFGLILAWSKVGSITPESHNPSQIFASNYLLQIHLEEPKQRFGEFKFAYFGGSDVENKLVVKLWKNQKNMSEKPI